MPPKPEPTPSGNGATFQIRTHCSFPQNGFLSWEPPCIGEVVVIARWDDGDEWPMCRRHQRALIASLKQLGLENRVKFEETVDPS